MSNQKEVIKILNFEIEWLCLTLLGKLRAKPLTYLLNNGTYIKDLTEYISSIEIMGKKLSAGVFDMLYLGIPIRTKSVINSLIELVVLRNYCYSFSSKNGVPDFEIISKLNNRLLSSFVLSKFNCSSFSSYDLRRLYSETSGKYCLIESRGKIHYCFPTVSPLANKETLILKESKAMINERNFLYPKLVDQGLIK